NWKPHSSNPYRLAHGSCTRSISSFGKSATFCDSKYRLIGADAMVSGKNIMQALVLHQKGKPLVLEQRPVPQPGPGQVLLRVLACAVCRTDLHVVDGDLPDPNLPL